MKTMQYQGGTFNGEATIEIKKFDGYFMIYIEQTEMDEERDETHLFGYHAETEEEANEIYNKLINQEYLNEEEIEEIGFQYM